MSLIMMGATPTYTAETGATGTQTPTAVSEAAAAGGGTQTGTGGDASSPAGIQSMSIDAAGHLIVALTDGRQLDAGQLPAGAAGSEVDVALTVGHVGIVAYGQQPVASLQRLAANTFRLDLSIPAGSPGQPRFTGAGEPPVFIAGARPGDQYLDTGSGTIYTLR